jgi:hypothetical protein
MPIFLPRRPDLPTRRGVAQGDLGEGWVIMCRARQHGDAETGPHKSAHGLVFFALEGQLLQETQFRLKRNRTGPWSG